MATLVLTAVGTLVGGPIGGAIGSLIGNQVDRALFSPKGATGPRLGSLTVQNSAYGSDLARLFGTMRVAGSVIWATDLMENKHSSSNGKGQPKTTSYSYSASFAVALSARAIGGVGRIWADGNLLRGAGGDWKSGLGAFRLHLGDETQTIDPLIAAAEGLDTTPAYRGLAYAVFEDLQLADFGNRIPSLSFEVMADVAPVTLAAIAAELSDGAIGGSGGPALIGYAAGGDSVRGAVEGLAASLPVAFADGADGVALVDESAAAAAILDAELGSYAGAPKDKVATLALDRQAAGTLNAAIAISYYDPALDYQLGSQGARREAGARRAGTIDLPAAISAADAKSIAEARLAREWAGRTQATVSLPWRRLDIGAGAILSLPGQAGRWRVTQRAFEGMALTLTATRLPEPASGAPAASAGRGVSEPDLVHGPTTLALLDLPSLGDDPASVATVLIAAAGVSAGWRRASVTGSLDGGATWQAIGDTAPAATLGTTLTALPAGGAMLFDESNMVDVELLSDAMTLGGSDSVGVSASVNLALIGDELLQFGRAAQIGDRRFRLGHLLRGRRGSEWAMAGHGAGERFVLVDPATLLSWTVPTSAIGTSLLVAATGIGDAAEVEQAVVFQARALCPPAPVAVSAVPGAGGAVSAAWTRRSRAGWSWMDGADAPIGEEAERYRLSFTRGTATASMDVTTSSATIPADLLAGLAGGGAIAATVAQVGTIAPSLPPATLILP